MFEISLPQILIALEGDNLLPAIVFRTARAQCDLDVERVAQARNCMLDRSAQSKIREYVYTIIKKLEIDSKLVFDHPQFGALLKTGVGAHHAGQLLVWRLLLEELMSAGLLRVLVATGTVAAGVDFPARTVIITADSRRGPDGYRNLTAAEFQQMSGRAGRRGKDTVGFCLAAPSRFCDPRNILKVSRRKPEPLESAYYPSPSTILNLLRYRNADDLRYTVDRSLASFMDRRAADSMRRDAEDLRAGRHVAGGEDDGVEEHGADSHSRKAKKRATRLDRQAEELAVKQDRLLTEAIQGLGNLGYLEGSSLSEKGFWASNICTNVVLELAEMIDQGMMNQAPAERMICLVALLCGEEHRRLIPEDKIRDLPLTEEDLAKVDAIVSRIRKEKLPGLSDSLFISNSPAVTALLWHRSKDWEVFRSMLNLSGVQEGDAARLITQTAEQLNQLTKLYETHPGVAEIARYCRGSLLRPPLTEIIPV
ncbi:MAG: helicase-related protein [bacterium]|nr:helicase-related protein [bacterium]